MAFVRTDLGIDGAHYNANLPREHTYTTVDTSADVDTAGYFNDAADLLVVGDRIAMNVDTDGTPAYGYVTVNSNTGGVVDVTNFTAYPTTDGD